MGGLKRHLPATYKTFLIGALAIAGIPPLAGFFSKDEILHAAAGHGQWVLYAVGLITAGLTAFYMFRAVFMTFHGKFRGTHEQEHHLHESPSVMTIPLWILAAGAIAAGWLGLPGEWNLMHHFLGPVILQPAGVEVAEHHVSALLLAVVAVAVAGAAIFLAFRIYGGDKGLEKGRVWAERFPGVHRLLSNKYYVDELYDATVIRGFWATARGLFRFDAGFIDGFLVNGTRNLTVNAFSLGSGLFDKYVVDGLVNLIGTVLDGFSRGFRRVQTGYVANYALVLVAGMFVLICVYMVWRLS